MGQICSMNFGTFFAALYSYTGSKMSLPGHATRPWIGVLVLAGIVIYLIKINIVNSVTSTPILFLLVNHFQLKLSPRTLYIVLFYIHRIRDQDQTVSRQ